MPGRAARIAIVAAFLLLLVLPGLQMATGALTVPPLDENRNRAPFPPAAALADPAAYAGALHGWFVDHYGFRDLLIRAKTQLDYSVFGTSDRLHIGRKGFLYYRSTIDISELQVEAMTDGDLDRMVATFSRLRDWLARRGIRLIVQTQQLKDRFYPEYLPRDARFARTRHRFDDVQARLAAIPDMTYIDTTPMLTALKQIRPIYHKTDFHWNDPAAYVSAGHLADTIAVLDGRPTPMARPRLAIVERPLSGGQALFMPLFHPPSEMTLFTEPNWDPAIFTRTTDSAPFEWRTLPRPPDPHLLPPTVIFGDSFIDGMVRAGFLTYFNGLSYARMYHVPFDEVMRALPPDTRYVVVECVETAILSWMDMKLPE